MHCDCVVWRVSRGVQRKEDRCQRELTDLQQEALAIQQKVSAARTLPIKAVPWTVLPPLLCASVDARALTLWHS